MARVQTLVQLNEDLLESIDEVAKQTGENRSALIRRALREFLRAEMSKSEDERFVEGYTRIPSGADPGLEAWAASSLEALVDEEPW